MKRLSAYWNGMVIQRNTYIRRYLMKKYHKILEYIDNNINNKTCPICRRRFKTKYSLYRHLTAPNSTCGIILLDIIRLIHRHVPEEEIIKQYEYLFNGGEIYEYA